MTNQTTHVDSGSQEKYTVSILSECVNKIDAFASAVSQLQTTVTNLEKSIGQSQSTPSTGGEVDMAKRLRERLPVGVNERGEPLYEWLTGYSKLDLYLKAAEKLYNSGQLGHAKTPAPKEKHMFSECDERYLKLYEGGGVGKTTYACYRQQMEKHILPAFGSRYVEDIGWVDIQQLYNEKVHLNKESKRKIRTVLNIVFNGALKDEYILKNPTTLVAITGKPSTPREILSVEQMKDIITNIGNIDDEDGRRYMALAVPHAMIPEEILGLKWEDFDFENLSISICRAVVHPDRNKPIIKQPKEDARVRTIGIVPGMEQYIKPSVLREGFVFGGDSPISYQTFKRLYERVGRQIELYGATTYNFRHTVLTDAYDITGDVKAVQAQAGHATPTMTMGRYVRGRTKTAHVAQSIAAVYGCDKVCDKDEGLKSQ